MKNNLRFGSRDVLLLLIGLVPLLVAVFNYGKLPDQVAIHFEFGGEANGFIKKEYSLLVIGLTTIGLPLLFKLTRNIDPKRASYYMFDGTFELMRLGVTILLSVLFLFTIFYNLGYDMGIKEWGFPAVGVFFILIGNVLSRIRFNYFIGIRTPWTLSNEEVWRRTHRFSGPVFMIAGLLMILSMAFRNSSGIILTAVLIIAILPTGYSYVISRKINKGSRP